MDSTLFQIFSLGEILARLGQTLQTGCLHVFNQRESANIFFKDGLVVAAARGLSEGEDVIKQVLGWTETHMVWQRDEIAPKSFKSIGINIADYLDPQKSEPAKKEKVKEKEKEKEAPKARQDSPRVPATRPVVFVPEAPATPKEKPVPVAPVQKPIPVAEPAVAAANIELSATKSIGSTALVRSMREEALVEKYKLVLVSAENRALRLKLARAFNLIGRNPACDITLNHASVSRQHCLLHITERGLHVKDLETTNGTKVNGIVLTEGYVNIGDKLTIGHELFILEKE